MTELIISIFTSIGLGAEWFVLLTTLTGGLVTGVGAVTDIFLLRVLGLCLQIISLYVFADIVWYPFTASILRNYYFISCVIFTVSAISSAYLIDKKVDNKSLADRFVFITLCIVGVLCWYIGGIREVFIHIVLAERLSGILLIVSATSIFAGLLGENIDWHIFHLVLLLQLPVMALLLFLGISSAGREASLLVGWGITVWPITFFIQYRILGVIDLLGWKKTGLIYHLVSLWLLYYFSLRELTIWLGTEGFLSAQASVLVQALFTLMVLLFIAAARRFVIWPVRSFPSAYRYPGTVGIVVIFVLLEVISIT